MILLFPAPITMDGKRRLRRFLAVYVDFILSLALCSTFLLDFMRTKYAPMGEVFPLFLLFLMYLVRSLCFAGGSSKRIQVAS